MMGVTLALVLFFGDSASLASAYGIAVTGTMGMTTILFIVFVIFRWGWASAIVVPIFIFFFCLELVFFASNMIKFGDGGWVPLLFAILLLLCMGSWKLGRVELKRHQESKERKTLRDVVGTPSNQH